MKKVTERKVTTIPASISRSAELYSTRIAKRRVAGYARVSTDHDEQLTSYQAQVDYYTGYIKSRDDWEFVGMYTDEGISATNTRRREGFKAMIADAKAGNGLKLSEISAEDASKIKRGWSYRRENGEVKRCAGLFYTAKEYLMNHTDKCRMHIYASFIDKDNKDHQY